jgi:hypothetical protein
MSFEMSQEAARMLKQMEDVLRAQQEENHELRTLLESRGMAASQIDQALRRACRVRNGS